MADNFDLRQFLTENKLTKNAKLLKEEINSNVEDIAGAFHEAGLTGMVTVLFQSDSSMGEPDINTMPAERAMKLIIRKAANAESVIVVQGSEITKGEQIGDYEEETEGLECKVIVEILDKGVYEIYQGSNDLEETSRSMKNKMNEEDNYKYFDEEGTGGFYMNTIDGVKIYSLEDSSIMDTCGYALEDEDGYIDFISIDVSGEPVSSEDIQNEQEISSYIADFIEEDINSQLEEEGLLEEKDQYGYDPDNEEWEDDEPFTGKYVSGRDVEEAAPPTMQAGFDMVNLEARKHKEIMRVANKLFPQFGGDLQNLKPLSSEQREMVYKNLNPANIREASYKVSKNSKEAQHLKKGDIIGSGEEVVSVSAGAKTPKGKVEVTLKTKDGKTKTSTWGKTTKIGVKEKETVKENTMTQRDKYLTRLVENALGLQVTEEEVGMDGLPTRKADPGSPDFDPNDIPPPPKEINAVYEAGDEMVEEKPLPKYENIEKLMQEIDKNTDQEAHKFKMQEMKRVADMLEKKCTALEEGDDADHIDQKKLKQMKKDIMSLRKNIEKMEKVGEKKFAKKETKADLKEGFDLRKFLVENKLTRSSRIIEESAE